MACGVAPFLLGMVYRHLGIPFTLATGYRRGDDNGAHNWVEVEGHAVDLTATQYGDEAVARVVPVRARLYIRLQGGPFDRACESLRADPDPRHYWHPRRHHGIIVESFAAITRSPIRRAVREVTAAIGGAS